MKIGLIGPGTIAKKFANDIKAVEGITLAAVASRDIKRAEAFAKDYSIKKAYGSYDELYAERDIDAVYISVPHSFHADIIRDAIMSGKAVLCEKPMVTNSADAKSLFALAKVKGVLLMEAMWSRFLPSTAKVMEWLRDGRIGETRLLDAAFCFSSKVDPESRLFAKKLAGGALYDVGVYCLSFAIYMADCLPSSAAGFAKLGVTGVDETDSAILSFPNGINASCLFGVRANSKSDARIYGTDGYISMEKFWGGGKCTLCDGSGKVIESFEADEKDGFKYEIAHFAELYKSGKLESPLMPAERTIAVAEIFDKFAAEWGI